MTFKGGIQPGMTAFDEESRDLDTSLKQISKSLAQTYDQFEVVHQFNHAQKMQWVGDDCFGFAPDGGAWFLDDELVAVFEAKKQNASGNAQERWWDNACTAQFINNTVRYHTFCRGSGCATNAPLHRLSRKAPLMLGTNFTFSLSETGFTKYQIESQMRAILDDLLKMHTHRLNFSQFDII